MAIEIKRPNLKIMELPIVGTSPLICHNWSDKAIKEMLDKQMGKNVKAKTKKDPEKDFKASLYPTSDGGYGFPAVGFKNATVSAARTVDGLHMVSVRQMIHILADDGDLVRINGTPRMRRDMVRLNGKTADIRFRGEFPEWSALLRIQFNADVVSAQQVANLVYLAGFSVGVGEWRIEKSGIYGTFTLAGIDDEVEVVEAPKTVTVDKVAA